jgi:glucoamylase
MPLAWAHAEHIKLLRSLKDGVVFDLPPQAAQRYVRDKQKTSLQSWRLSAQAEIVFEGRILRIELLEPGTVRWSSDNWQTSNDMTVRATHRKAGGLIS